MEKGKLCDKPLGSVKEKMSMSIGKPTHAKTGVRISLPP